jgi:autotransporter translocation and assembly factor TamB
MTLAGFVDDPEIIFSAAFSEGMYKGLALSELHIQSTYRDERADAEASFLGPEGKLADLRGTMSCRLALYPFAFRFEPETFALTMAADDLSIADLAPYWPPAGAMDGRISGYVNIFGDADGPVMDASLAGSELVYRDFRLPDIEGSAAYQADTLQILAAGFRDDLKVLDVSGAVPVRLSLLPARVEPGPDSMRVSVHVHDFDISNIDGLTRHPEYAVTGKAEFIAEVGGSINDPLVMGRLFLREGSLYLRQQRLTYQSLEADLEFDSDRIAITEIRAVEDDEGFLSLTGIVHHDRFRPGDFDIRAVGSDVRIPFYPGLSGRMSPDLRLQGTRDAPVVSGDIRIPRGQVNLDVLFSQHPSEIKIIEPAARDNGVFTLPDQPPPALTFPDPLRADITVTVPGNVWLRGEDESIEIRGKVNLEKEPGRSFVVHGPLSAVRGTYRFRGKLFKITSGELNFIGQDVIDPPLDIQAETRIGEVRIIIYLTGTYERLNMRFDSDPPMDEVDIISYLIFGRPQTSLTEGESFRAAEAALAITGQIAADELREILGDRFRIDYIDISAGSGGFQHGSLSMGKYVTPRVFVIYRHTFAAEDPQQVEVYYEINRHFSLETQANDEKTLGVDLIWKYEF